MENLKAKFFFLCIVLLVVQTVYGQNKKVNNHFKLSISNVNYLPLQIKTQGVELLDSYLAPSFDFGFAYSKIIAKHWGFELGMYYSQIAFNVSHHFFAENNVFSGNTGYEEHFRLTLFDYFQARLSNNVSLFKSIPLNNTWAFKAAVGVNFDITKNWEEFTISESAYIGNYNSITFFEMELNNYSPINFYVTTNVKLGFSKRFKNDNFFGLNLVACYAPSALLNGNFKFSNIEYESKGIVKFRPSYFGVEFNYAFALKKKINKS